MSRPAPPRTSAGSAAAEQADRNQILEGYSKLSLSSCPAPTTFADPKKVEDGEAFMRLAGLQGSLSDLMAAANDADTPPYGFNQPGDPLGSDPTVRFGSSPLLLRAWALEYAPDLISPTQMPAGHVKWW